MTFTVSRSEFDRSVDVLTGLKAQLGYTELRSDAKVAKVSVVGLGMRSQPGVAKTMFKTLAERGINIEVISTSEIKVSVLIDAEYTELAVRALHAAFGLDRDDED
jgi:aspartate kinase